MDRTKLEHWRYFIFGTAFGALIIGFMVSVLTQWVEHGDAAYPVRSRLSRKGKGPRYDLL